MQISGGSSSSSSNAPAELGFQTFYVNSNKLKHALAVTDKSAQFTNIDQYDWTTTATISL